MAAALLPWRREAAAAARDDLVFRGVSMADGSLGRELARARARPDWTLGALAEGCHFVAASTADGSPCWQLRAPPVLREALLAGSVTEADYWRLALAEGPAARLPAAAVVLLLGAGHAALGVLRLNGQGSRKGGLLRHHKVISTYAVRGGEKKGTGRFQLFEDKKKGGSSRSEGAKLRRKCAIRFFEKINEKLAEWREEDGREGWPPFAVFFAGDMRLRRLLLDCRKPACPLPEKGHWVKLPAPHAGAEPSFEALQRAARDICCGEVVEVAEAESPAGAGVVAGGGAAADAGAAGAAAGRGAAADAAHSGASKRERCSPLNWRPPTFSHYATDIYVYLSLSLYIYIYTHNNVYTYIYIYRDRKRVG